MRKGGHVRGREGESRGLGEAKHTTELYIQK